MSKNYIKGGRKCSFRFMFVDINNDVHVITQDIRRRRNVVTGRTTPYKAHGNFPTAASARAHGCSVLIRVKGARLRA